MYPGDCNVDDKEREVMDDRKDENLLTSNVKKQEQMKNTPGNVLNVRWSDDRGNELDPEVESSRALNTKPSNPSTNGTKEGNDIEIVEPVLRPRHSAKNGRSHDPAKERPEITEPILSATTKRATSTTSQTKLSPEPSEEIPYAFVDAKNDWTPFSNDHNGGDKWKREDGLKGAAGNPVADGFNAIVKTVQFLPQRLARMFEDAEKYAREAILPLVSNYTPRFISDIINPRPKQRYVPLVYEDATTTARTTVVKAPEKRGPPAESGAERTAENETRPVDVVTPYTHIQKIRRNDDQVDVMTSENIERFWRNLKSATRDETSPKPKSDAAGRAAGEKNTKRSATHKNIYIDLPVFMDDYKSVKYIPLVAEGVK